MSNIPLGLIRTITQPARSKWRAKRPYFSWYKGGGASFYDNPMLPHLVSGQRSPHQPLIDTRVLQDRKRKYVPGFIKSADGINYRVIESNLSMNDLRFWSGGLSTGTDFSQCRSCETAIMGDYNELTSEERRHQHQEVTNCTKILRETYKTLLDLKTCAICDVITKDTKWGIPLCYPRCQELWKCKRMGGYTFQSALEESRIKWAKLRQPILNNI